MSTHRFILEPYKGVSTRHTCPNCHRQRCFSKYIDTEKQIKFPEYVGRCDHEQKCGYHFTPRDYFEQNPSEKEKFAENSFGSYTPIKEVKPIAISYMDLDIVLRVAACAVGVRPVEISGRGRWHLASLLRQDLAVRTRRTGAAPLVRG